MGEWHLDVNYTMHAPGALNPGINLGVKLNTQGLYGYYLTGLGRGAGWSVTFINGRVNPGVTVSTWIKGGYGMAGSYRYGVNQNNQNSTSAGIGIGMGLSTSVGARQTFPIIQWRK